jgi:hypothetical protein
MPHIRTTPASLKHALVCSRTFFREHELEALADALPSGVGLAPAQFERYRAAQRVGFDRAWVFPAVDVQRRALRGVVQRLATAEVGALDATEEYRAAPSIDEELRALWPENRPDGAYLLLHGSGAFPPQTQGVRAKAIEEGFWKHGWSGLSVFEYLVLQRASVEEHGDHRFAEPQWLLDTRADGRVAGASWKRRVELGLYEDRAGTRRGAHPTVIVSLG